MATEKIKRSSILLRPVSSPFNSSVVPQLMLLVPAPARPPPTSPPTRAWVEEEGRPNHHVTRFHADALSTAARRVGKTDSACWTWTRPSMVKTTALLPEDAPRNPKAAE